jgi:hypothetical protein
VRFIANYGPPLATAISTLFSKTYLQTDFEGISSALLGHAVHAAAFADGVCKAFGISAIRHAISNQIYPSLPFWYFRSHPAAAISKLSTAYFCGSLKDLALFAGVAVRMPKFIDSGPIDTTPP